VHPGTFEINLAQVEAAITPNTKAIVPVHLFGQCVDMESLLALAKKHKLYVIEDTAQAIGANYTFSDGTVKKAGTMGTIGCTSFFPSKNLGCYGDGGAMYTNDDDLGKKLKMIANHGQSVQYVHDSIGVNSRLDNIQAAILRIKLRHLDEYAAARNFAANYYDKAFANHPKIKTPVRNPKSTHVFHQYTLVGSDFNREDLKKYLADKGIPMMVYYPIPLHKQKAYTQSGNYPVTEMLCSSVFSLPIHTEMDEEQLAYITNSVLSFFN
jgi:dTDP-4-amino-4,6-dideoxygalactose transaminase